MKLDANGKKIWIRAFEGFNLSLIRVTSDNGLLLLDSSSSALVKLNENGRFQWSAKFGLSNGDPETVANFYDVMETPDQGYVMVGTLWSLDDGQQWQSKRGVVLKIDSSRKIVFRKRFGFARSGIQGRSIFSAPQMDTRLSAQDGTRIIFSSECRFAGPSSWL